MRLALAIVIAASVSGCYEYIRVNDPDGSPPPFDAGPDAGEFVPPEGKCVEPTGVDLLFVIDNSNSMTEEQESLTRELPAFVSSLVSPPDDDGDGELDWLPVENLHVGIVSTDMGTGGFVVPTCTNSDFGDDGILRSEGNTAIAGCAATYPSILAFDPGAGGTPAEFALDVSCVAQLGTGGCGFEQQLEAMLKAIAPAAPTSYTAADYVAPSFFMGTLPHGDRENAGFVRDGTLLAVVIVTDEEDCSARDPNLFDPEGGPYSGIDLNLRCFSFPEAVHPIERFVTGLTALRPDRPDLLAFALIAGVPVDLTVASPTAEDFQQILADPRMQERIDTTMRNRLVPSCNVPDRGVAFPPRRLVSVAQQLGTGRTTVQSICQESFAGASAAIARLVGRRACDRFEP